MAAFILVKLSDDDSFIIGELHNESEDDVVMKYPVVVRLKTTITSQKLDTQVHQGTKRV